MEVKRIKCPNCGSILEVRNSKNETVKLITCPQCKVTLSVKFKHLEPLEAHTCLAKNQQIGGETQLQPQNTQTKTACLEVGGRTYKLSEGVNVVGRKASSSQATVQIDTSDKYMSRQHAKIVVTRMPGGKFKAVISNDRNKNISTIDGQDLLQGDAIVLNDGDRIVMGETTVIYKEL